ncbi:MAG: dipeptidyl-peptidase 3 family protein [Bacteroidota bacterium]
MLNRFLLSIGAILMTLFVLTGCAKKEPDPRLADLDTRLSRLVQVPMHFDASSLPSQEKELLKTLVEASKLLHEAYLQQVYPAGAALRDSLAKLDDEVNKKLHRLVVRNGGPFDKMDHFKNFYGSFEKAPGAAFYPADLTKEEFEAYVTAHPEQADALMSPCTVVKRENGALKAVPYHEEYAAWVRPASELLKKASTLTDNPSLKKYLTTRAEALLTDDYYQSDLDWIDLTGNDVDVVIAPYEVYEDALMAIKASYEATVGVKDKEESAKLEIYTQHLEALEQNLPHDAKFKKSTKGLVSPMVIVTDIIRGGDIATGYQPVAANLPNDPRVHANKGTKKTFWMNMMKARVNEIILPVGRELIASDQIEFITPQGVFNFVLMHELCHALGPRYVHGSNDKVSVNQGLKDLYPGLEEGKADVAGLHSIKYFIDKGIIPKEMEKQHYVSYLASCFRTIRFGTTEAHGKAAICELNYIRDKGGIRLDSATKKWSVDFDKIGPAISDLAKVWLEFEATGDYAGTEEFFRKWSLTPPEIADALKGLEHLPVDVEPVYSIKWE